MRFQHTTTITPTIQETDDAKCWRACGESGSLYFRMEHPMGNAVLWFLKVWLLVIWPSNCACRDLPKWHGSTCPLKDLCGIAHNRSLQNKQRLETIQTCSSAGERVSNLQQIGPVKFCLATKQAVERAGSQNTRVKETRYKMHGCVRC